MPRNPSRRVVLAAGAAAITAAVAACRGGTAASTETSSSPPTPDVPDLDQLLVDERDLVAAYRSLARRTTGASRDLLEHLGGQHLVHLAALSTTRAGETISAGVDMGDLQRLERSSAVRLASRARIAAAESSAVLASIAASHAAHADVLAAHLSPNAARSIGTP